MNNIKEINADLFSTEDKLIIHGCNDQRVMGSGIAVPIKTKYPRAVRGYFDEEVELIMGDVLFGKEGDIWIANAITQTLGKLTEDNLPISYNAIKSCFNEVLYFCNENEINAISMPQIGAGLGGGDWNTIRGLLNEVFEGSGVDVTVYVWSP